MIYLVAVNEQTLNLLKYVYGHPLTAVSKIFLHKLCKIVSELFLESLKTQKSLKIRAVCCRVSFCSCHISAVKRYLLILSALDQSCVVYMSSRININALKRK